MIATVRSFLVLVATALFAPVLIAPAMGEVVNHGDWVGVERLGCDEGEQLGVADLDWGRPEWAVVACERTDEEAQVGGSAGDGCNGCGLSGRVGHERVWVRDCDVPCVQALEEIFVQESEDFRNHPIRGPDEN